MLEVKDLSVRLGSNPILNNLNFKVDSGHVLGLVGESGSGKSMALLSLMDLLPAGAQRSGSIALAGQDLSALDEAAMCALRGGDIGMVFQEPMTALNPLMTIGDQVAESLVAHENISRAEASECAVQVLRRVQLDIDPKRYPHQLSGGQRQRVGIAIAIAAKPKLLLADEPTTALDVTTQAEILELLAALAREDGCALIFVSHDLAVVSALADTIAILKDGEIVEAGATKAVLTGAKHPYSRALLAAVSHVPNRLEQPHNAPPVLRVEHATCRYGDFSAVKNVSFDIAEGGCVALIGESGCGKSTLCRSIVGLQPLADGRIELCGETFIETTLDLRLRHKISMVFQDPYGSFNPSRKIGWILAEPFHLLGRPPTSDELVGALEDVGLPADTLQRYPHQFSGGQRQRIALARAIITRPDVVILDEAISALDVSVRAEILDLLTNLRARHGLAYLFVSHDLGVVEGFADHVLVMRAGEILEGGPVVDIFQNPRHPYTKSLLAATPKLEHV